MSVCIIFLFLRAQPCPSVQLAWGAGRPRSSACHDPRPHCLQRPVSLCLSFRHRCRMWMPSSRAWSPQELPRSATETERERGCVMGSRPRTRRWQSGDSGRTLQEPDRHRDRDACKTGVYQRVCWLRFRRLSQPCLWDSVQPVTEVWRVWAAFPMCVEEVTPRLGQLPLLGRGREPPGSLTRVSSVGRGGTALEVHLSPEGRQRPL